MVYFDPKVARQDFPVSGGDKGWIVSLLLLGALIGCFLGGYLMGKYGRKITMYISAGFFTSGYALMLCAQNVIYLFIGRIICGVAMGITS